MMSKFSGSSETFEGDSIGSFPTAVFRLAGLIQRWSLVNRHHHSPPAVVIQTIDAFGNPTQALATSLFSR
jgi:hypothetical protein